MNDDDTVTLETDVMPSMSPMVRACGVHVSDVIHSLAVSLGHYTPSDNFNTAQLELGCAYEYGLIHRLRDTHPNRFIQPGEMSLDDLSGNMDQFDTVDWLVDEYKHTKITVRHDPVGVCPVCNKQCVKFWKWKVQVKAYCTMMTELLSTCHRIVIDWSTGQCNDVDDETLAHCLRIASLPNTPVNEARLRILFCRGDYKGRSDEQYRQWRLRFSDDSLRSNWSMLTTQAATLRCNECGGVGIGCLACNGTGVRRLTTATEGV